MLGNDVTSQLGSVMSTAGLVPGGSTSQAATTNALNSQLNNEVQQRYSRATFGGFGGVLDSPTSANTASQVLLGGG